VGERGDVYGTIRPSAGRPRQRSRGGLSDFRGLGAFVCEGVTLPRYDDGGFSGGNLDRPALAALVEGIGAGQRWLGERPR